MAGRGRVSPARKVPFPERSATEATRTRPWEAAPAAGRERGWEGKAGGEEAESGGPESGKAGSVALRMQRWSDSPRSPRKSQRWDGGLEDALFCFL